MKIVNLGNMPQNILEKISKDVIEIDIGCSDSKVYKVITEKDVLFLKIANKGLLTNEYMALRWLAGKLIVPDILAYEVYNKREFLLTKSLKGKMICSDEYKNYPDKVIDILVVAFQNIYNVDIRNCPFNVGLEYKLNLVEKNIKKGLIKEENISREILTKYGTVNGIYNYLVNNKPKEETCFSHGDVSLPNIFADDNSFTGFIDVGECGIADKWFDLAICEKSIIRNYGKNYVSIFYEKLDIIPNREKIDYYLLLMNLYL